MPLFSDVQLESLHALPRRARVVTTGTLLNYVFKGVKQDSMRKVLKEHAPDFDFLEWRRSLHSNGTFLKDGKVFTYGLSFNGGSKIRKDILSSVDLESEEKLLLREAVKHEPLRQRLAFLNQDAFCVPMTIQELDEFLTEVLESPDLKSYTKRFIRVKMSFLINSFNQSPSDLKSDLISWALYALLKTYPRYEDVGHGLAIAKTAIHNRGINLIKEHVTAKNNTLVHHPDGTYSSRIVPLDAFQGGIVSSSDANDSMGEMDSNLIVGIDGTTNHTSVSFSMKVSLHALSESPMLKPKQRRFLQLMLGSPSEEFSEFLGEPNEFYIEKADFGCYLTRVCDFMRVSKVAANEFLGSLRKELGNR